MSAPFKLPPITNYDRAAKIRATIPTDEELDRLGAARIAAEALRLETLGKQYASTVTQDDRGACSFVVTDGEHHMLVMVAEIEEIDEETKASMI